MEDGWPLLWIDWVGPRVGLIHFQTVLCRPRSGISIRSIRRTVDIGCGGTVERTSSSVSYSGRMPAGCVTAAGVLFATFHTRLALAAAHRFSAGIVRDRGTYWEVSPLFVGFNFDVA